METSSFLKNTPWDSTILGIDTYEILSLSPEAIHAALSKPGHYTIKIDPLAPKKILHENGFYYCDTLIEPYCCIENYIFFENDAINISNQIPINNLLAICHEAFIHGRFHRDFNIKKEYAEQRYINWLTQLHQSNNVYALLYKQNIAGFIAIQKEKLVLHALSEKYRGQGLAKFFWSRMCKELFEKGNIELTSSISASNLAIVNLYASLGFRFRNAVDVYHFYNGKGKK